MKIFFPLLFIVIACGNPDGKLISEVEKLETELLKSEHLLAGIDTSKIGIYYRTSRENLQYIQENFKDTIEKEMAIILSDYSASRKSLRMFLENYADVMKEIVYSKSQFAALKTDLQNRAMDEQQFSDYFSTESKSIAKLNELVQNLLQWHEAAVKMYDSKKDEVEKFIEQIKKQE